MTVFSAAHNERCKTGWTLGPDNKCYMFYNKLSTWTEANNYCKNQGGDLASINSKDAQEFLEQNLGICKYHISQSTQNSAVNVLNSGGNENYWH